MIHLRTYIRTACTLLSIPLFSTALRAQTIPHPSFERHRFQTWPGYCSDHGGGLFDWATPDPSAIGINPVYTTTVDYPFANNGAIPNGDNVAFIQSTGNIPKTLSTTISDLVPGDIYRVQCLVNARYGLTFSLPTMTLSVNNEALLSMVVPALAVAGDTTTPYLRVSGVFQATDTTATLALSNTSAVDGTLLIDDFTIAHLANNYFSYRAWTGVESLGIEDFKAVKYGYSFGTATDDLDNFSVGGANPSIPGKFAVSGMTGYGSDINNLQTSPEADDPIPYHFIYGGNAGSLQVQSLTPGRRYRLSMLGVGAGFWGTRYNRFHTRSYGYGTYLEQYAMTVDENLFADNNGICIDYFFTASTDIETVYFTPENALNTFHLYGFLLTHLDSPPETGGAFPVSQTTLAGAPVQYDTTVEGLPAPTCQWYSETNGLLPGETNTILRLNDPQPADTGNYYMVAENFLGSTTCQVASLTVLDHTLTSLAVAPGSAAALESGLTHPDYSYQWLHNGTPVQTIVTVAGGGDSGWQPGYSATNAALQTPKHLCVGSAGDLYIEHADWIVRKVSSNGIIENIEPTISYTGDFLLYGSGDSHVAALDGHLARGKSHSDGQVHFTVGLSDTPGFSPDGSTTMRLNNPSAIYRNPSENRFYFSDTGNNVVRWLKENQYADALYTAAGGGSPLDGLGDNGSATNAALNAPGAICIDNHNSLYICDTGHHRIRKVINNNANPGDRTIETLAGNGTNGYSGDGGAASQAQIGICHGIVADSSGYIYFSDSTHHCVRKISPDGTISTIAGTGSPGHGSSGTAATGAALNQPWELALTPDENLLIADSQNDRVLQLTDATEATLSFNSVSPSSFGNYQLVLTENGYGGASMTSAVYTLSQAMPPPAISNLTVAAQQLSFDLSGAPGQKIIVESSTNLMNGAWTPLQTNTMDNSPAHFSTPTQPVYTNCFFRLRTP